MFTLSQASYDTKEILKWGGLFIGGLVLIVVFIQMFLVVKEAIFPTPPPKPTLTFGKLDPQLFPASITNDKLTYKVNTLTGALPSFAGQAKVFKIKTFTPDLLSLQNAKDKVAAVGFKDAPTQTSDVDYTWSTTDQAGLNQKINMDVVDNNFTLTSDFISNQAAITGPVPNEKDSITTAIAFLSQVNTLPSDIDTNQTKTSFFTVQNGSFTQVVSLADAKAVRVDFFQKDVDNLPLVYEQPGSSNLNIFVGPSGEILQAQYFYQTPSSNFATYPIETSTEAYQNLQQGIAYIASYNGSSTSVSITDVYLAYYVSSQTQKFLMPVFVFEGSNNFIAYVPAITGEWISK
jgi:hypothetical protein